MSLDTFRLFVPFSELLAAIVGTIYFYKYKQTHLRFFLYILWYIVITELTGLYTAKYNVLGFFDEQGAHYNLWMYNLLRIFTFSTIFYIYMKSINTKKYKQLIKIFLITYLILVVINWSFIQSFIFEMSEIPKIIGSLFVTITVIFYFIELLKS